MTVGVTTWEPEVDFEPVQATPAEHDDVLVEDQERVDDPPEVIDVGEADRVTVGAGVGGGGVAEERTI